MTITFFDTLKFAKRLKDAGVDEKQAETQAELFGETFELNFSNLATKEDIAALKEDIASIKGDIASIKGDIAATKGDIAATKEEIKSVKSELHLEIQAVREEMKLMYVEIKREIESIQTNLNHRMDQLELKSQGQFQLLHWMIGLLLAGVISIVIKTFFVP